MARRVPYDKLIKILEDNLLQKIKRLSPDDPNLNEALIRIGSRLERDIKINIRRERIVDTGTLFNSIRYRISKTGNKSILEVGSFGVPYARMHEFGGPFTARQRKAMFASLRNRGKLKGNYTSKNVIQGNTFRARPYLRPAMEKNKNFIIDTLQSIVRV